MTYEITGNRHMGSAMKKKQALLNEWKVRSRRKIMPGYPIEKPFETREEVEGYLNVDRMVCLLCGKAYKALGNHLPVHGTDADRYKEKYGLPIGAGLTCETTKAMNVKHGKKLVADGIFRAPTPEEHAAIVAKRIKARPKPAYAAKEATQRIAGRERDKTFNDDHYWKILEIAEAENKHPTDVSKEHKGNVPCVSMMHAFKKLNSSFYDKYHEIIEVLPIHIQLKHGYASNKYLNQIKELRDKNHSNLSISKIMNIHENSIEKHTQKHQMLKPDRTTCGNGIHPYPGYRKHCQPCNTIKSREINGCMDRNISKITTVDRQCTDCGITIQVKRIYGAIRPKYCEECKKKRYYASQKKYYLEKRPFLLKEK